MARTVIKEDTYHNIHELPFSTNEAISTTLLNRVAWGAVFAGVTIAFAVQLVLNLFGAAMGMASLDSLTGAGVSTTEFSWGAALWWIATGIIAAFAGGFTAGRLAGEPKVSTASWHGLMSWAAATLMMTILLMSTASGAIAGMSGPIQLVMDQEVATVQTTGGTMGPQATEFYTATPEETFTTDAATGTAAGTQATTIDADTVAIAALVSAIALVLGAGAAWFGGGAGTVNSAGIYGDKDRIVASIQ